MREEVVPVAVLNHSEKERFIECTGQGEFEFDFFRLDLVGILDGRVRADGIYFGVSNTRRPE